MSYVTHCEGFEWTGGSSGAWSSRYLGLIAGSPSIVTADNVKPGAIVLDVGVSRVTNPDGSTRIAGDVDPAVAEVAAWVSPNPGGVGPMTRALLLKNVVETAERATGL